MAQAAGRSRRLSSQTRPESRATCRPIVCSRCECGPAPGACSQPPVDILQRPTPSFKSAPTIGIVRVPRLASTPRIQQARSRATMLLRVAVFGARYMTMGMRSSPAPRRRIAAQRPARLGGRASTDRTNLPIAKRDACQTTVLYSPSQASR